MSDGDPRRDVPEPRDAARDEPSKEQTPILARGSADIDTPASRTSGVLTSSPYPLVLERIEPSLGRGERLRIDAAHRRVRMGRAEHNDIRLYTASASREHAEIVRDEAGEWVLTPAQGKIVGIDGTPTSEPVLLEVGMNIMMGGDQLRCATEGLMREKMSDRSGAEDLAEDASSGLVARFASMGMRWGLIAASACLGLALLLFKWISG